MTNEELRKQLKEMSENAEGWYFYDMTTKKGEEHKADGDLLVGEVLVVGDDIPNVGRFIKVKRPSGEIRSFKTGTSLDASVANGTIAPGKRIAIYFLERVKTKKGGDFSRFVVKELSEKEFQESE